MPGLALAAFVTASGVVAAIPDPAAAAVPDIASAISYAWEVAPNAPALSGAPVNPASDTSEIQGLQYRLSWTGLDLAPSGVWDDATTQAVKRFQWKYNMKQTGEANAKVVATLVAVAGDGSVDPRCLGPGITLCVDKTQRLTRYIKDGVTILKVDTNFGPEKGDPKFGQYSFTREGEFRIFWKNPNSRSNLYGMVLPYFMAFDGGEGFHFSKYFSETGYADTSMGCATMNDLGKAKWLYNHTPMNTKVVIYHRGNGPKSRPGA